MIILETGTLFAFNDPDKSEWIAKVVSVNKLDIEYDIFTAESTAKIITAKSEILNGISNDEIFIIGKCHTRSNV